MMALDRGRQCLGMTFRIPWAWQSEGGFSAEVRTEAMTKS